jgi:hypothetical protein
LKQITFEFTRLIRASSKLSVDSPADRPYIAARFAALFFFSSHLVSPVQEQTRSNR